MKSQFHLSQILGKLVGKEEMCYSGGHAATGCVFQSPEVQAFDLGSDQVSSMMETTIMCWEKRVSQNLASSFRRTELMVHPLWWWAWGWKLSKMLSSRQTKHSAPGKWWLLSLQSDSFKSFLSHLDLTLEWQCLCEAGKRASVCSVIQTKIQGSLVAASIIACEAGTYILAGVGAEDICASCG